MNNRKKDILTAVLLSLFIISFAVCFIIFFKSLYHLDIDLLHISEYSGYTKEVLIRNYDILIDYMSIFYRGELHFPDFRMSETGRIHFEEVKRIFEGIQILMVTTGILSALCIYNRHKEKEYRYLKMTSILSIEIPLILGLVVCADFDSAFIIMHKIFFRNEYWIFDLYDDPIVGILPHDFFMYSFIAIIIVIVVLSLICYFVYKRYEKRVLEEN